MLKQRVLTALVLIPIVLWAILFAPTWVYQGLVLAVVALAAVEWLDLIKLESRFVKAALIAFIPITAVVLFNAHKILLVLALLLWLLITAFVVRYAHITLPNRIKQLFQSRVYGAFNALLILTLFLLTMIWLHNFEQGAELVIYVMVSVWLADTGGYFAGKRWGKHKLAEQISPNKTWQGVAGAVALVWIWAVGAYFYGLHADLSFMVWLSLATSIVLISIVGDLYESLFKRAHQVKDSGNLLPGHGGMLDRVDSLLAAVPTFTASLYIIGGI